MADTPAWRSDRSGSEPRSTLDRAATSAHDTLDRAATTAHEAVDHARDAMDQAQRRAHDLAERAGGATDRHLDGAAQWIADHPMKALAGALVAGYLVGRMRP